MSRRGAAAGCTRQCVAAVGACMPCMLQRSSGGRASAGVCHVTHRLRGRNHGVVCAEQAADATHPAEAADAAPCAQHWRRRVPARVQRMPPLQPPGALIQRHRLIERHLQATQNCSSAPCARRGRRPAVLPVNSPPWPPRPPRAHLFDAGKASAVVNGLACHRPEPVAARCGRPVLLGRR